MADQTHRRQRVTVACTTVLVSLAACTGDDDPAPPSSPTSDPASGTTSAPPTVAVQVWALDLPVVGQPRAAGDVAVVYAAAGGELKLVGVDPASGEELWSQPASPGEVVTGIPVTPAVVTAEDGRELPAYFRPDATGNLYSRLVVADPRTGADIFVTEPLLFQSQPDTCPDERDVCLQARATYQENRSTRRLRLDDGALQPEPAAPEGFLRSIGPIGLSDVRRGDVEFLARIVDGAIAWEVPIADVFGAGYSTDGGWGWDHYEDDDLLVGHVGRLAVGSPGTPQEVNFAEFVTVALTASTGELVWRDEGSQAQCRGNLPLPRALDDADGSAVPVRCRYAGGAALRLDEDPLFVDLDVTVEGFDLLTGETAWTLPMGAVEGLVYSGGVGAVAGPEQILLPTPDGPRLLDLITGQTTDPPAELVLICASEVVEFDYREPYYFDDLAVRERSGEALSQPCDSAGRPTTEPVSAAPAGASTLDISGTYVTSTEAGLVGYQLR